MELADVARPIRSTIDLNSDLKDDFTALLTHHVSDDRPLAPNTVISETRLPRASSLHRKKWIRMH